jgi:hypothetical protein
MTWWPGWDAIESAGWWVHFWFWFGIACLILLTTSEIIAYRYGLRKDQLSADEQQRKDTRHADEVKALQVRLQPRTITPEQRAKIIAFLAPITPKGEVVVIWKLYDEEAEQFGKQVISVLNDAGFQAKEGAGPMSFGNTGAWIVVRDLAKLNKVPNPAGAIQAAFRQVCGIEMNGQQRQDPFPDLAEVVIAIGAKP